MVRYRKGRRYGRRRSTNVIRMKFQSFMDISTNATSMQIINISAGGKDIMRRLAPQFSAYKYFMIGKISAKLVPASTLPVDPTGLSITAGDNLVDPRDQLTPGLMRITNGEDVFENISGLSDAQQHGIYNNMLLDPRWFKWMLQSGVKRHAYPRYWQIGQLHQDKWPGALMNYPGYTSGGSLIGTQYVYRDISNHNVVDTVSTAGASNSNAHGIFQVGHSGRLGWLPTDGMSPEGNPLLASPPEVEVMKIILPKAYKTRYWYRLFITEEVLFREPIVNFGIPADDGLLYRPLDVFHEPGKPTPYAPGQGQSNTFPGDGLTGGNYGDN